MCQKQEDVIEAPEDSQRHAAAIARGARMLASGRFVASVADRLKKGGMSSPDIDASRPEIQSRGRHPSLSPTPAAWERMPGFSLVNLAAWR